MGEKTRTQCTDSIITQRKQRHKKKLNAIEFLRSLLSALRARFDYYGYDDDPQRGCKKSYY